MDIAEDTDGAGFVFPMDPNGSNSNFWKAALTIIFKPLILMITVGIIVFDPYINY